MRVMFILVLVLMITVVPALLLRKSFPQAWARWVKRAVQIAVASAALGLAVFLGGRGLGLIEVSRLGLGVTAVLMVAGWLIAASGLLWAPAASLVQRWERRSADEVDPERRRFLMGAVASVPASAVVMSPVGTAAALADPVLKPVDIAVEGLHPDLEGLKILQLTDIHLGTWIDVDQVEKIVELARASEPDLVVLTGDLADDMDKLPDALKAVLSLSAPLGVFACIGNHEIYRGRARFEQLMADSPINYLCGAGQLVQRGAARLWMGGSDDPARLGPDASVFLQRSVKEAMWGCPSDVDASVMLSHRPEGFEAAAALGVTLTLSGHTHGGQVAVGGRSVFEGLLPYNGYLLGTYKIGASHLYTSAGLGHWLPFRVGCPCEGALITLRRA